MNGLRLTLSTPDRVALDDVLVGIATVVNDGPDPVTTSSRLNLIEGDLGILVSSAGGMPVRAAWPWPVDSALRQVELAPHEMIEGGVLLLFSSGSEPLFRGAGRYTMVAEFTPVPGEVIRSDPVTVLRTEPAGDIDREARRALEDRDVLQALASASPLGQSNEGLHALARGGSATTRLLATMALGTTNDMREALTNLTSQTDPLTAAATITSVLPAELFAGDARLEAVAATLDQGDDARAAALLRATPLGGT